MTAVVLKGTLPSTGRAHRLCAEVGRPFAAPTRTARSVHRADGDIGHGLGAFDGCVKTPGRCRSCRP